MICKVLTGLEVTDARGTTPTQPAPSPLYFVVYSCAICIFDAGEEWYDYAYLVKAENLVRPPRVGSTAPLPASHTLCQNLHLHSLSRLV